MNSSTSTNCPIISIATSCGGISIATFAGKEKDLETGLSYFDARYSTSFRDVSWQRPQASLGALLLKRYYDADLLTSWLSVDPMADKSPSISPYAYCAWTRPTGGDEHRWIKYNIVNNPVKLVDPDGEQGRPIYDYGNIYQRTDLTPNDVLQRIYYSAQSALQILDNSPEYKKALQNLQFSVTTTQTSYYSENGVTYSSYTVINFFDGQVDAVFQKAQANWTKKYNSIIKNNTIESNGYRGLNIEGFMSLIELGPSPYSQVLKIFEDNKSEFKTSSEYKLLPVIRQTPLI